MPDQNPQSIFQSTQLNQQADSIVENKEKEKREEQKTPSFDKKQVIAQTTGGKKSSPLKFVLFFLVFIIVILLGVLVFQNITGGANKNKPVTLTWWSVEEDVDAVVPVISEYEQQHPNVKINFVSESKQDYADRLLNSLAKGQGPDIFEFHNTWVPMFGSYLAPTKDDFSSIFYPVVSADLKTKNGFIGVPLEYDGISLFVNEDILNTYSKNPPKTWDDLRAIAQTMTLRNPNGTISQSGAAIGVTTNIDYWQDVLALLMLQNGADLATPSSAQGESALTFLTDFSNTDKVWDETLPQDSADFVNGKLAMYFAPYYQTAAISKQNPNLHYEVVPLPQVPNVTGNNSIAYASYFVNGVSLRSQSQPEAWDFLKFMTSANTLRELYNNEKRVRGYGNLYPRVDMQSELLSDAFAGPFIYQASFAKSWYLASQTLDGINGINSQISKPYGDAIESMATGVNADQAVKTLQPALTQALANYGLAVAPSATP